MSVPLTEISLQEFDKRMGTFVGGLFIFYLLLSGNFTGELLNCQFQSLLRNIYIKHAVGFFMLYFFVNLASTNVNWNAGIKLGLSFLLFIFFILSNRCEGYIVLINIGLLALIYILQLVRDTDQIIIDDEVSTKDEKKSAMDELNRIRIVQIVTTVIIFILIVLGFILYVGRRKLEFGPNFKLSKLIFSAECANDERGNYSFLKMFKAAFATPIKSPDNIKGSRLSPIKFSPNELIQKTNELSTLLDSPLIRKQLGILQETSYNSAAAQAVNVQNEAVQFVNVQNSEAQNGDIANALMPNVNSESDRAPLLSGRLDRNATQSRRAAAARNFEETEA
jgi:hypothetical protein